MLQNIGNHLSDTSGIHQGFFPIDGIDLLVVDIIRHFDGVDKIDAEREHIAIVYGIDNSVSMQLGAK